MQQLVFLVFIVFCIISFSSAFDHSLTWGWMLGNSIRGSNGNYNTKYIQQPSNSISSRFGSSSWVVGNSVFIFGGEVQPAGDYYYDMWRVDLALMQYTWVAGDTTFGNARGNYGTIGNPSLTHYPGGRGYCAYWRQPDGLYIFGGYGYGSHPHAGFRGDMWRFDPQSFEWTWIRGSSSSNVVGNYGSLNVPAASNVIGARRGSIAWYDEITQKAYIFGGYGYNANNLGYLNDLWTWDGTHFTWVGGTTAINNSGVYNSQGEEGGFPGGRENMVGWVYNAHLWIFGGKGRVGSSTGLLNDFWKYNLANNKWTWVSGNSNTNVLSDYTNNRIGGRESPSAAIDSNTSLVWIFGGDGYGTSQQGVLGDLWVFNGSTTTFAFGSTTVNSAGVYGTQGHYSHLNLPGARMGHVATFDPTLSSTMILFGGFGRDSSSSDNGRLNCLWRMNFTHVFTTTGTTGFVTSGSTTGDFDITTEAPSMSTSGSLPSLSTTGTFTITTGNNDMSTTGITPDPTTGDSDQQSTTGKIDPSNSSDSSNTATASSGEAVSTTTDSNVSTTQETTRTTLFNDETSTPTTESNSITSTSTTGVLLSTNLDEPQESIMRDSENGNATLITVISVGIGIMFIIVLTIVIVLLKRRGSKEPDLESPRSSSNDDIYTGFSSRIQTASEGATFYGKIPRPSSLYSSIAPLDILRNSITFPTVEGEHSLWKKPKKDQQEDKLAVPYSEIKILSEIGHGSFGKVFKAEYQKYTVAVKVCTSVSEDSMKDFLEEAKLMINLRPNPYVLQILGLSVDGPHPAMILEYCENGSLDRLLYSKSAKRIAPSDAYKIIKGIAVGMLHLHKNCIIHRDLAARNILISDTMIPKIGDFGLSRFVMEGDATKTQSDMLPIRWMAPESLQSKVFSKKSDIWTFAILMSEIVNQTPPHQGMSIIEAGINIRDHGATPEIKVEIPKFLHQLFNACWSIDPEMRPDFSQICDALNADEWK